MKNGTEAEMEKKQISNALKAKITLEALREIKTLAELSQEYGVHPGQIIRWKKQALENFGQLFDDKRRKGLPPDPTKKELEAALKKLGQTTMELEWLKKKLEPYQ